MSAAKGTDVVHAGKLLAAGKLVAIPTETVYGLAANAFDTLAVTEIFRVKDRPHFDPLILHIGRMEQLPELVSDFPPGARKLAETFWPGPLTLLLPKSEKVPDLVTAGSDRVAIRMPDHPLSLDLLNRLDFPLAAPSANPFGYISPTRADHVLRQLGDQIDYVLDGGPCRVGLESTIVGFEEGQPLVHRKGGIPVEKLADLVGPLTVQAHSSSNPLAPGMLKSHYAPRIPVLLGDIDRLRYRWKEGSYGILSFHRQFPDHPPEWQVTLSEKGDLSEAARNLFAGLRRLDEQPLDGILAELVPEEGLGRAINDRLRRAAART